MTVTVGQLVAALVCFVLAAGAVRVGRLNLVALGLACWVATLLVGSCA